MSLVLPSEPISAERVNPKRLVIYSTPKSGKTTSFAGLKNNLILDLENGSDFISALKVKINSLQDLREVGEAIKEKRNPYKYVTIDTVSALEKLVLPLAKKNYMATTVGKSFKGDNVLTLPMGAGYFWHREAFFQILDYIDTFADNIILSGHIKDKSLSETGDMVSPANIDLTGKIKTIICANSDAIGYLYRKGTDTIISFKANNDATVGARSPHLANKEIKLITQDDSGNLEFHWDEIYK